MQPSGVPYAKISITRNSKYAMHARSVALVTNKQRKNTDPFMIMKPLSLAAIGLISLSATVLAVPTPYGSPGTINPVTYSFTATGDGPITAYFVGESAGYGSTIGLSVNGGAIAFGSFGLQNHTGAGGTTSTPYGTSFFMGNVAAGDVLRFVLAVDVQNYNGPATVGDVDYYLNSDASLNPGGENHIFASAYAGDALIPAGTYVGFEDISPLGAPGNDRDYNDHQFVFVGVRGVPSVPEGGVTMVMLGMAVSGLGLLRRKL